MDFRFRMVVIVRFWILFKVIRVYVDDNASVGCLMLMHEDCATCHNNAKENSLEIGEPRTDVMMPLHNAKLIKV